MAIKPEGGKALMARPLRDKFFLRLPLSTLSGQTNSETLPSQ